MDEQRDRYPRRDETEGTYRRASSAPLAGSGRARGAGGRNMADERQGRGRDDGRRDHGARPVRESQGTRLVRDGRGARGGRHARDARDAWGSGDARGARDGRHARPRDERAGAQERRGRHGRPPAPRGVVPRPGRRQLDGRAYQLGQGRGRGLSGVGTRRGGPLGAVPPVSPRSLVTLAGGVCALVLVSLVVHCALLPGHARAYNGSGGMEGLPLFSDAEDAVFAASLLLPDELTPILPGSPTISGTTASGGSVLQELTDATHAIEQAGFAVGYAMLDLSTGVSVSYNADAQFYSASSIKGPYVTSVVRYELGDSAQSSEGSRISAIIESSDNAAYSNMRDAYGNSSFAALVDASGAAQMPSHGATSAVAKAAAAQSGASIADNKYEFFTPNQMLALWQQCYEFLSSGKPGASWLAGIFETPETSAIRVTAGTLGTTWSKAGWYPAGDAGFGTTVDAGVVRTSTGDVLVSVMTTEPENFAAIESVLSPLLALRSTLA
ncbi:serine hydrolase [uncultured Parolsenella sp.]|uniref:serine hydrolase n=1 Tax=uncultured Parolsenella sp. TaxID=2083008 RepID=UPI0027DD79E4|nr:serine hydrolase [uncultured Parolsenella sp.]